MSRILRTSVSTGLALGLFLLISAAGAAGLELADEGGQRPGSSLPEAKGKAKEAVRTEAPQGKQQATPAKVQQSPAKPASAPAAKSTVPAAPAKANEARVKPASESAQATKRTAAQPVSFIREVAPILVESCIACHNPKKTEGKYVMTTFAQLAKGGQQGEGITLEPSKPDESNLVELIRPDGQPRMPYKQDPLTPEKIALIEKWVAEGAKYDGGSPSDDWTIVLRKTRRITIPQDYPATVPITALEFSRDGSTIAASGYHEITFWNTADGNLKRRLSGLAERVYDVAYSPDGKWLATASGDPGVFGVVKLWLAEPDGGGKPVRDLVETQDAAFAVAFSPDSKKIATAGADRTLRLFEVETGKLLFQIEDHADWVLGIAFSPDGKRLATASRDKTAKVFDVEKKESLVTFPGHGAPVYTVSFTPDGKGVATGGEDSRIRIWNPDSEAKAIRELGGFGGTVFKLRYAPDGKNLLACGADKNVAVFTDKGSQVRRMAGHQDWIYSLAVSRDGRTVASGGWDGEVRLWNLADGKLLRTIIAAPGFKQVGNQAAAR
ncbi:MAG TPA: c-type cytochrome domain-containing protein [Isosphaeraceae bacterium]|nr:c-type cytochrome domain-containing protein [Isosphaeraceae bacterium]